MFEGKSLRAAEKELEKLRQIVGFIFQANFLKNLSIEDNIIFGLQSGKEPSRISQRGGALIGTDGILSVAT